MAEELTKEKERKQKEASEDKGIGKVDISHGDIKQREKDTYKQEKTLKAKLRLKAKKPK